MQADPVRVRVAGIVSRVAVKVRRPRAAQAVGLIAHSDGLVFVQHRLHWPYDGGGCIRSVRLCYLADVPLSRAEAAHAGFAG